MAASRRTLGFDPRMAPANYHCSFVQPRRCWTLVAGALTRANGPRGPAVSRLWRNTNLAPPEVGNRITGATAHQRNGNLLAQSAYHERQPFLPAAVP